MLFSFNLKDKALKLFKSCTKWFEKRSVGCAERISDSEFTKENNSILEYIWATKQNQIVD